MSLHHAHTLLVVGGGFGQLPAIHCARSLGMRTVVVDRSPAAVGMRQADVALPIDTLDIDAVVAAARRHRINGVITMQSDAGVPTVSAVVEALGLPGNGSAAARICGNKISTRRRLAAHNIPQPDFLVVASVEDARVAAARLGFPCVIKAPDNSGSRGIVLVHAEQDVPRAVAEAFRWTRGRELLVEQFIRGTEIGAQTFSINGTCAVTLVHDDVVTAPPYMIPVGHGFPSSLSDVQLAHAKKAANECVEALGITTGPSNIDMILDQSGEAKIIEVGMRVGATCLPELVRYHTGIDWVEAAVRVAVGEYLVPSILDSRPCAAYVLEAQADGIFLGYTVPEHLQTHTGILEWEVTANPGDRVSRLRSGTDRIGKVVTTGATLQDAMRLAAEIRSRIAFDIHPVEQHQLD